MNFDKSSPLVLLGGIVLVILILLGIWSLLDPTLFRGFRSDEAVEAAINEQLALDARVDADNVIVEVDGSEASLTGTVDGYAAYQAAVNNAITVAGINVIDDNLVIEYDVATLDTSDDRLEEIINDRLLYDSSLNSFEINVNVDNGIAELSGEVDSLSRKNDAENIAFNVVGVTAVENELAVVPTEDIDDERIAENIVTSYENNIYLNASAINVRVADNIVTLSGTVDTLYEYDTAEDIASQTIGVVDVNNDLIVN